MVTVPASAWRGGRFRRALTIGAAAGLFLGARATVDSGKPIVGAIVFVCVGTFYGWWMTSRMARYWPGAADLTGDQRVAVVAAARRGRLVGEPVPAHAVVDYSRGLHAAAEEGRPIRWVIWLVLVVSIAAAAWDAAFGSWLNLAASVVYLALLVLEIVWWPKRLRQLLSDADQAAASA